MRYTIDICKRFAKSKDGKCLSMPYKNSKTKLIWECKKQHQWEALATRVVNSNTWCPYCYNSPKTLSFCQEIANLNDGKCLSAKYVNNKTAMLWECKVGHKWCACFSSIFNLKTWCPYCNRCAKYTIIQCQEFAKLLGGKCLSSLYNNVFSNIQWECAKKHVWEANVHNVIYNKTWCTYCTNNNFLKSLSSFMEESKVIHGDKYNYSKFKYINSKTKGLIICNIASHGGFLQKPDAHLRGQGCPKCFHFISKPETEWLNSLLIPEENRHKSIYINGKRFNLDAFDPITNTIYEFYGDYWHGNPNKFKSTDINKKINKTYGELFIKTIEKEKLLIQAGYKLVSIWEEDWMKKC